MGASPELPPSLRSTELQHSKQVKHDAAICKVPCLALPAATGRRLLALAGLPLVRSAVQHVESFLVADFSSERVE